MMVMALDIPGLQLGHVRAGGIVPFRVAGRLRNSEVSLVMPGNRFL